ncbi:hypothetical protein KSS87_022647 [Heliosperma pusillum]|nr:hypothetical protein KSS87_022647 [Heliosperma pusillum]
MSAILFPVRLCQNPIRAGLFSSRLGLSAYRILPSLTRFVNVQDFTSTRIASWESWSTLSNARTVHYIHSMSSEKEAALAAASTPPDSPTIFDKIINKEIPANVVYEDDQASHFASFLIIFFYLVRDCKNADRIMCVDNKTSCIKLKEKADHHSSAMTRNLWGIEVLAFRDINPQAPIHILIIPKIKDGLSGISKAEERHFEILGRLLYTAKLVAKQEGLEDGFRVVINDGPKGCQSVYHIHVHLLGGRQMEWPAG